MNAAAPAEDPADGAVGHDSGELVRDELRCERLRLRSQRSKDGRRIPVPVDLVRRALANPGERLLEVLRPELAAPRVGRLDDPVRIEEERIASLEGEEATPVRRGRGRTEDESRLLQHGVQSGDEPLRAEQSISFDPDVRKSGALLDARQRLEEKRRQHQRRWEPTPEMEKAIVAVAFGSAKR